MRGSGDLLFCTRRKSRETRRSYPKQSIHSETITVLFVFVTDTTQRDATQNELLMLKQEKIHTIFVKIEQDMNAYSRFTALPISSDAKRFFTQVS